MVPGTVIAGKYRLSRELGEGAMGVVWAAVNQLTEREVALKLIPSAASRDLRARLLREARSCGRITHRNVVEIYDVGETGDGAPFLVMQLLSGETLQERLLREQRLSQALAVKIGAEIAKGLVAAHGAHIIHRDLKPGNVFLHTEGDGDFVVKLLDFGVSKLLTHDVSSTTTGSAIGSPAYMSPEQARGLKDVGPRADLWALGVVLFEMIAGRRPFDGETPYAVVAEILGGEIPSLEIAASGTDAQLCGLVARCLERDLTRRVSSATEVQFTLQSVAATFRGSEPVLGARRSAPPAAAPMARASFSPAPPGERLELPDAPTAAIPWMPEERETVRLPYEQLHEMQPRAITRPAPPIEGPGGFRDPLAGGPAPGQDQATVTSTSAVLAPGATGSAPLSFAPGMLSQAPGPPPPSVRTLVIAAALSVLGVLTISAVIFALGRSDAPPDAPPTARPPSAAPEALGGASAVPTAASPAVVPAETAAIAEPPAASATAAPAAAPPKVAVGAPKATHPTGIPTSTAPKPAATPKSTAPSAKKKSGNPLPRSPF